MPRFVEIGFVPLLKSAFPDETHFVDTRFSWIDGRGHQPASDSIFNRLKELAQAAIDALSIPTSIGIDLVAVRSRGPENPRPGTGYFLKKILGWSVHQLAIHLASKHDCKLVVIDRSDETTIHPNDLRIIKRCDHYFKRELPWSSWSVFERLKPAEICIGTASGFPSLQALAGKLTPLSLGVEDDIAVEQNKRPDNRKKFDVFYLGKPYNMERRLAIDQDLADLEKKGLRVFRTKSSLTRSEFLQTIRESRIAVSPGGVGWDCFRHYEIPACGTALLIERPSHQTYAPPLENIEAIHYDPHLSILPIVTHWLQDPGALERVAAAGRSWVHLHHSYSALGKRVVEVALTPAHSHQSS